MTSKCIFLTFAAFFSLASGLVLSVSPTSGRRAAGTAGPPAPRGLVVAIVREESFLDKFGLRVPKSTAKQADSPAWQLEVGKMWAALVSALPVVPLVWAGLHFADVEDADLRAEMRLVSTRLENHSPSFFSALGIGRPRPLLGARSSRASRTCSAG